MSHDESGQPRQGGFGASSTHPPREQPPTQAPTQPLAPVWSHEQQRQAYPGYGPGLPSSHPGMPPAGNPQRVARPRARRGPGWGALFSGVLIASLLAGALGGVGGAWLATNGYLDFGPDEYTAPAPQPGAGASDRPEGSIANISANALPSVVTVLVASGGSGRSSGSGWAFDDEGHIVTNNHVIAGAVDGGTIMIQTADGQRHEATIVGRDESYDLAVLLVNGVQLNPLPIGVSADVRVGDGVIAMGAPLGLDSTVTAGIVSALNRPVSPGGGTAQSFINAIQTDAAINPGNSGGPLLSMAGQVVGVNTAIATTPSFGTSGGNIGVGFAIPSDQVSKTVEQLIRTGTAEHPIIGVLLDRQYQGEGVKILDEGGTDQPSIVVGGPAASAGLRAGDVILEFEGRPMTSPDELVVAIRARNVGDQVTLLVQRGSATLDVTMTLQGRTADQ
ncbi:MAG: trypsin-like peptidase domain-containing protein [Actinomycetia bacterium]|nr:trypsin-like peptidase domain-containing protein [Actinomycetes bacterium]